MNYEALLIEADSRQLKVKEKPLKQHDGLIVGDRIAIRKDISTLAEKSCVLAEELGHYYTTSGNILDQSNVNNQKQEQRARLWAYNKKIGLYGIINGYKAGCRNATELAEYLNVTEEFLLEAIVQYRNKYGICKEIDNYIIFFIPNLAIMERISN